MRRLIAIYYSIKFSDLDGSNEFDTFEDFQIVPESRPFVAPPEVKTEYVEIPGADGALDYTEALAGLKYKNREGTWTFYVLNPLSTVSTPTMSWNAVYSALLANVHGKKKRVILESDPDYYYLGRIFVDQWNSDSSSNYSKVTLKYILEPWKYPILNRPGSGGSGPGGLPGTGADTVINTRDYDWLWTDLFSNVIYYGTFDVVRTKYRNLINPTGKPLYPSIYATSRMTVTFGSSTYEIPDGNSVAKFRLAPGDNHMKFEGNGRIIVDYSIGRAL